MVFEDAHWIDPTSRELLDLTLDRVARLPVLLVVTFRPEFQHAWGGQPHVTMLALNRLGGRDGAALVERLAGNAGLSPRDRRRDRRAHRRRAAVRRGADQGGARKRRSRQRVAAVLAASPLPNLAIPATLHASLIARLDRLGPIAKEVGADRRGDRPRVRLRADRAGGAAARQPSCELGSTGSPKPGCCSAAASRRNPPTCSSTRWCRTPPTAPCCARGGRNCTPASRRCWSSISPISSSASPNSWPII